MDMQRSKVQVMGIDAGGTMTDTFFVREDGNFVVGKAQSNPADESLAIYNSSLDALSAWQLGVDDVYPELVTCVYSGTAMLNRVVQRKGLDVGLIVNKGFEQTHSMGRAIQSYLGYALEERLHLNTHRYDEPLVPYSRTRGVTERTDVQGRVVIPLREEEMRQATRELVEAGAKAIVIVLLQSHKKTPPARSAPATSAARSSSASAWICRCSPRSTITRRARRATAPTPPFSKPTPPSRRGRPCRRSATASGSTAPGSTCG
ncbi:hydantoinase/oxoprolinase N-terminal domain-containing protein [Azotobacter vinelandii]